MSQIADEEKTKKIWQSIKRYLLDPKTGGIHLNTPILSPKMDMGRAFGFSYGDKENGSYFSHMNVMLAYALYQQDFIKEGRCVISSLYNMSRGEKSKIYPLLPEYFNNQAQGLYSYLTGSASWLILTLFEQVLGIQFQKGDLKINPKLMSEQFNNKPISCCFYLQGKTIEVIFKKVSRSWGILKISKLLLQGQIIPPSNKNYIIARRKLLKSKNKRVTVTVELS